MKVLPEEINIIIAALRVSASWFRVVAKAEMEEGRGGPGVRHINSATQCELLGDRLDQQRMRGSFLISDTEFKLICAPLDLNASLGMEDAQGIRAAGGPDHQASAQEKEI